MPSKRRPRKALQSWEVAGFTRFAYLEHYIREPSFRDSLCSLFEQHCIGHEDAFPDPDLNGLWTVWEYTWPDLRGQAPHPLAAWARVYPGAVAALAEQFGLDRLGRDPSASSGFCPSEGEQLIHRWCSFSVRGRRKHGAAPAPDWFLSMAGCGGAPPQIGEVVSREEFVAHEADGVRLIVVDEQRRPLVHVTIEDEWNPREERMDDARTRLLALARSQIEAELERIATAAEARGAVFLDSTPKFHQHIRWLFERVALKRTYQEIAQTYLGSWDLASSVYNRIKPYARTIGLALKD